MGRGTSGVKGMNVSQKDNRVLALNVARDDAELLVVTENGFGKRTALSEYPIKNRGTKGVLTAKLTETKGGLAGALIVREHQDLLFITENGMVQRTSVEGIRKTGRPTQGVKVMNVREGDHISAVALVVESDATGDEDELIPAQEGLDGVEAGPENPAVEEADSTVTEDGVQAEGETEASG
jgi:DNA gyrase subunit A